MSEDKEKPSQNSEQKGKIPANQPSPIPRQKPTKKIKKEDGR